MVERQLYHDPESVPIARELAGLYIERNDPKRALAKLQVCFKADPRDVHTLEMLAEAFRQLGQSAKTISVLKEIVRLHAESGDDAARLRTIERVLELIRRPFAAGLSTQGCAAEFVEYRPPHGRRRRGAPHLRPRSTRPPAPPPLYDTGRRSRSRRPKS